jgi:hypothetical protein
LKAVEKSGENVIIHDTVGHSAIGEATTVSHTSYPEPFFDNVHNVVYYDCPGFQDSRRATPSIEIANAIFLKWVADHAESLKVLVAVNHFSVRKAADRNDFLETLTHLANLFNVTAFRGGIGLVVTKVEHYKPDEKVIGYIADFLLQVQENLHTTSSQEDLEPKKRLLEEFLQKNSNGTYARISLFRRPMELGLLSTNEPIQKNKKAIQDMVNSLVAIKHTADDVGYVLSTDARLLIKDVHAQLRNQTTEKIKTWLGTLESVLVEKLETNGTLTEPAWTASQLEANFKLSRLPITQDMTSLQQIIDFMVKFQPRIDQTTEEMIGNTRKAMIFLQKVDSRINPGSWADAHQLLQKTSESIDKSLKNCFGDVLERFVTHLKKAYPHSFPSTELASTEQLTTFVQRHLSCIANHQHEKMKRWKLIDTLDRIEAVNDTESLLSCFEVVKPQNNSKGVVWLKEKILLMTESPKETYGLFNTKLWQPMQVFFGQFLLMINRFSVQFDNENELEVHGDVLSLKKVVNSHEVALYRGKMRKLSIIARHTIFLDTQVNGTDLNQEESLDLTIISPFWWASPGHKITLDGKPGARYPNTTRSFGTHGKPGVHGGNAGSFFGLGLHFHGTSLHVSAKGGDGGPGEDGAEGEPGVQGEVVPSISCSDVAIIGAKYGYSCLSPENSTVQDTCVPGSIVSVNGGPGSPGSDGGDGGVGGVGGKGGHVSVWQLGDKHGPSGDLVCNGFSSIINEKIGSGANGQNGAGGIGGQGGLDGFKTEYLLNAVQRESKQRRKRAIWSLSALLTHAVLKEAVKLGLRLIAPTMALANIVNPGAASRKTVVREFVCFLEPLGVKTHANLSARAPSGKNGREGFVGHEHLPASSALLLQTNPNQVVNCTNLLPDKLHLLKDPEAAFESFDKAPGDTANQLVENTAESKQPPYTEPNSVEKDPVENP